MDYRTKAIEPAVALLRALNEYVADQLDGRTDSLSRVVDLRDTPDADLRRVTVADVLAQEADHARKHLTDTAAH